jgi:hypothetical protein
VNVRRLAAIDMYGTRGTARRKRIVLAEFTAALAATVALGTWLVVAASGLGTRILGIWLIGAGLNYAPLTAFAISLSRPGALKTELAHVDTGRELRRYSVLQLWILVPVSLIAMTVQGRNPAPDQLRILDALAQLFRPAAVHPGHLSIVAAAPALGFWQAPSISKPAGSNAPAAGLPFPEPPAERTYPRAGSGGMAAYSLIRSIRPSALTW